MKKRILFDGTCISSLNSGVGNYAMSLLQSLQSYQAEAEFHVLVRPGIQTRGSHLNAKVIGRNENRLRKLAPWDFCGLGRQFSLLHEPNYVPQRFAGPVVVTIHDLTTFMFPRFHPVLRVCWARSFRRRMLAADHILTVSQHSKQDIVDYFHVPEEKITVTYLGCPSIDNSEDAPEQADLVLSRFSIRAPFILNVGTLEPRKNINRLLEAFALFGKSSAGREFKLVLAGGAGWALNDLQQRIASCGVTEKVVVTGYVSKSDLSILYRRALAFVYPSLYEGFGLPPLEAMAHGTPVIVSNTSSLPEVVGDAGIMVDPWSTESIAAALNLVSQSDRLRQEMRLKGLSRAAQFSWDRCAAQTMAVYRNLMG